MGIKERKEREKQQRRDAIIDAAEKVFFRKGIEIATMDEVAETAELSKGTLYLYFKSKQDLYLAVTKRGLDILTEMSKQEVKKHDKGIEKIHALGKTYHEFSKKYPDYFQAMVYFDMSISEIDLKDSNAEACQKQGEEALMVCVEALKKGIDDGSIRSDIDPLKVAVILWGHSLGILRLISIKQKYIEDIFAHFQFKNVDDVVDYSFELMRRSLASKD